MTAVRFPMALPAVGAERVNAPLTRVLLTVASLALDKLLVRVA